MTPIQIKALRIDLGLSQAQLAEAVGVTRTSISAWEQGHFPAPRWFGLAAAAGAAGLGPYQPSQDAMLRAPKTRRVDSDSPALAGVRGADRPAEPVDEPPS